MSAESESRKLARIIMEEFLEKKLPSFVLVHHKNENPLDNRIENLQLVTRAEHAKIHSGKDQRYNRKNTKDSNFPKGISFDLERYNFKCNIRVGSKRYQARKKTLAEAIEWRRLMESYHWGNNIKEQIKLEPEK